MEEPVQRGPGGDLTRNHLLILQPGTIRLHQTNPANFSLISNNNNSAAFSVMTINNGNTSNLFNENFLNAT